MNCCLFFPSQLFLIRIIPTPSLGVRMTFECVFGSRLRSCACNKVSSATISAFCRTTERPLLFSRRPQLLGGNCEDTGSVSTPWTTGRRGRKRKRLLSSSSLLLLPLCVSFIRLWRGQIPPPRPPRSFFFIWLLKAQEKKNPTCFEIWKTSGTPETSGNSVAFF